MLTERRIHNKPSGSVCLPHNRYCAYKPCRTKSVPLRRLIVYARRQNEDPKKQEKMSDGDYIPVVNPVIIPPPHRGSQYRARDEDYGFGSGDNGGRAGWGGGGLWNLGSFGGSFGEGGKFNLLNRFRLLALYLGWSVAMYYVVSFIVKACKKAADLVTFKKTSHVEDESATEESTAAAAAEDAGDDMGHASSMAMGADGTVDAMQATAMSEEQRSYLALLKHHEQRKAEPADDFGMHATAAYIMVMGCIGFFFVAS